MRKVCGSVASLLLVALVAACGSNAKNVVQTTGTTQSRAAVTPTSVASAATQSPLQTATVAVASTSIPTVQPTTEPTSPSTQTTKTEAVTVVDQGFGASEDGGMVGWAFVVQNPNPGLAFESSQYQVAFSDDSGTILETDSGYLQLLLPSEKTAVSGESFLPEGTKATKMDVTFNQGDSATLDVTTPFKLDKATYFPDEYLPQVTGIVTNPYAKDLQDVQVSAVAYDASNAIIGGGFTFVNFIPSGGSSGAAMTITTSAVPDHVELYASISGLTSLEDSTSSPDKGQALVISKQGFGLSDETHEVGYGFIVENPNADQPFESSLYQVAAYDDSGTVVGTDNGYISLILGGQKLGVGGTISVTHGTSATRLEVQVLKGDPSSTKTAQIFSTENVNFVPDSYFPKVTGVVKNLTAETIDDVEVSAIAYDANGNIIGGGYGYVDFVPANGQSAAEASVTVSGTPATVELYPNISIMTSSTP